MAARVVISGMGMVTPLGNDVASSWEALLQGRSGVGTVASFDPSQHDVRIAAEARDFDPLAYLDRKDMRRTERFIHFAAAAAQQAVADSGLEIAPIADEVGVVIGSGSGGLHALEDQFHVLFERGADRISPFFITQMVADMACGFVSMSMGARGPNFATVSACATGANAIGEAYETIKRGDAVAMIAGGTEAGITPMTLAAFASMHALSRRNDDPERASRPFDAERDGFVMGEGAGVVVLEELEHARARGATIYAEVLGYASTSDAHHITDPAPGGAGLARALRRALKKAELAPERVDYINAHGTSTKPNDRQETAAIKSVFGEHASKLAISSTKSMTGHLMGAAGGIEIVITALALRDGMLPPTINYEHPDPECDLDYVPNMARKRAIRVALSNSMGFGGHNAVVILGKPEE
ncbi:MAG: 3-oxoacyl-[acyl-carrier-protein] synthase, KASII [Ktedonobacterales bacterium]|nr:MAG: 3-oxoacyl-[acyl-carrier-protein] synthase, KASII [Ktedonobacterales bacterium]